jgi:hypothetical protein
MFRIVQIVMVAAGTALVCGCNQVTCATGTIERGGSCVPADETTGTAMCGPNTMLVGNQCVPTLPPTVCGSNTTPVMTDAGVIACVGTGGGGCSSPLACPNPSSGATQTICGQIYDFEDNTPFTDGSATGAQCGSATTSGPCSLAIQAYDAIAFAMNPATAQPLANGGLYIDDCGRFRLTDVAQPSGPYIGLGLDDANAANMGPPGTTNTVGVAVAVNAGGASPGVEDWIVKQSTTNSWAATGGPAINTGVLAMVFRANCSGTGCTGDPFALQAGVEMLDNGNPIAPANGFYFAATDTGRTTIDSTATVTGMDGTGLINNASLSAGLTAYSGSGGLTDPVNCKWPGQAGASLAYIVFIQIMRPINQFQKTCTE